MKDLEKNAMIASLQSRYSTNHILHLLLCIPTLGLWVIIWILVALSNAIERGRIERRYKEQ